MPEVVAVILFIGVTAYAIFAALWLGRWRHSLPALR